MERTKIVAALALVCLLVAFCATSACAAKSPYVIGAVFDSTGPASPLGTPERDTVKMIADQLKKSGGINGHPVEFIILDNGSEETKCVMAVKKLIETHKVKAIIGPSTTGTTLAVAPICEKAKIPLISCAAGVKITKPARPYVFKTAQADAEAMANIMDYLKSKGIKSVGFIADSNAFGQSGKQQLTLQSAKAGVKVTASEVFASKDTDMTTQLTRIKSTDPKAVICWGTNPGPAIVARNMKQLGMSMPLIMSHGISNRKFIELAGDAANGVIFPAGRITVVDSIPDNDPQKKVLASYANMFKQTYGREADSFGGYAWDAAQLVLNALRKGGDDPARIRAEIEKTRKFVGVSGVFNFSARDHNGLSKNAFVMVQIKNGDWSLLK